MKNYLLAACLFVAPVTGMAHEYTLGDLMIDHPMASATMQNAMTAAGYFTVTNNGTEAETLLEITAAFPRVMLHDTKVEDGIATMFHLEDGIEVPAGETITFAPGGRHVMFMGLKGDPFEVGEEIPAVFSFEKAGTIEVVFQVEDITSMHDR